MAFPARGVQNESKSRRIKIGANQNRRRSVENYNNGTILTKVPKAEKIVNSQAGLIMEIKRDIYVERLMRRMGNQVYIKP